MLETVRIEIVSHVMNERKVHNAIVVVVTEAVSAMHVLVAADGLVHRLETIWMHVEMEELVVILYVVRISVTIVVEAK